MKDNTKLTDEQVDKILEVMEENKNSSESLKMIADLPSNKESRGMVNPITIEAMPEEVLNDHKVVEASEELPDFVDIGINNTIKAYTMNIETGEITEAEPEIVSVDDEEEDYTDGESFDDLLKKAEERIDDDTPIEITEEDVAKEIEKNEDVFGGFNISRDALLQVLSVVNRVQNKEVFNIYKALPEEVQNKINAYIIDAGGVLNTVEGNTIRNDISKMLIDEFISNISLDHYTADFQKEMNALQNKVNEEFSKMYRDYDKNRSKYIEAAMENETDPEKKEAIGAILDAINDGFNLNRLKTVCKARKIRIKKFELEKPARPFGDFINKYRDSKQNIYSIYMAYNTLYKHMQNDIEDDKDILRFFIAICKFCMNYKPENPTEHAFMYYAMYNPILLDVYRGDDYTEFYEAYKKNVLEVIELLKLRESNR